MKLPQNKLDVKIIAFDLDDTLLSDDLVITDKTLTSVRKAASEGIYTVICSGRQGKAIMPFVDALGLDRSEYGRYIISQNGAIVFDLHEKRIIYENKLSGDVLTSAYHAAKENGFSAQVYDFSTIYSDVDTEWARRDSELCKVNLEVVKDFESFLLKGHTKMVLPNSPEKIQKFLPVIRKTLSGKAVVFTSKPYLIEIMREDCGKGQALLKLAERLGIDKKRTMAFGDAMNDESMIQLSGHSVAMKNGDAAIKEEADYVTRKTNCEDGIADFLDEFVL